MDIHIHIHHDRLEEVIKTMGEINTALETFRQNMQDALDGVKTSLDNIAADEAQLAKEIADLKNGVTELSPENQAKLDALVANAQAMASRSKEIADSVPDVPPTPAG